LRIAKQVRPGDMMMVALFGAAKIATLKDGQRQVGKFAEVPTQSKAATMLNVSGRSVRAARVVLESGSPDMIASVEQGKRAVSAVVKEIAGAAIKQVAAAAANIVREGKPATAFKPGHPRHTLADIEAFADIAPGIFNLKALSPPSERANCKETFLAEPYIKPADKYFAAQEAKLGPVKREANAALPIDIKEIEGGLSTIRSLELRLGRYVMTDFDDALALAKHALERRLAA
jgi:hypothetical protein